MREKFLVTDTVPKAFLEGLEALGFEVLHLPFISNEELIKTIGQFHGIVVNTHLNMDAAMLDAAVQLKYILRPGSGLDNIDIRKAKGKGIVLLNSPEANRDAVGEHAIGLLLSMLNYVPRAWEEVRTGKWIRQANTGVELKGKTVGIIGYGNTGSAFAAKLQGFEAEILVYDRYYKGFGHDYIRETSLEEIQERAQVVSIHVPLTDETFHMVNDNFIAAFRNPFYFINTARGKIVDQKALLRGLQSGKVLGAGLDVLENEKISGYSPEEWSVLETLFRSGNVIVTPHIAGWTKEAREKIFFFVLDKFRAMLAAGQENAAGMLSKEWDS